MDEFRKRALHGTLATLKELKSEYRIGSRQALGFLKRDRLYESLLALLPAGIPLAIEEMTSRQWVAWIVDLFETMTEVYLQGMACIVSTPETFMCESRHIVDRFDPLGVLPCIKHSGGEEEYLWGLDYHRLFTVFMEHLTRLEEPWKVSPEWVMNTFGEWIKSGEGRIFPFLISTETRQAITLEQFLSDHQEPKRIMSDENLLVSIDVLVHDESSSFSEEELQQLIRCLQDKDVVSAHQTLRRYRLRRFARDSRHLQRDLVYRWRSRTNIAEDVLHDCRFLERASRELTLGRIEVERRYVLNKVYNHKGELCDLDPATAVDYLVEEELAALRSARESIRQMELLGASAFITDGTKQLIQRCEYALVAFQQNRSWLLRFLTQ